MPLLSIPRKLVIATEIIVSDLKNTFFLCRKLSNNKLIALALFSDIYYIIMLTNFQ